ncbi:hypothetical protein M3M33_17105, partial [Loigolactobacillus coryniformis]|uniref:hypothetical protein n=1 Tax=Loigolactobacillus coryniformis TaxID=1610 RepID=UPI00201ABD92
MNDLLTMDVPDSCKEIQDKIMAQYIKEKKANFDKDAACRNTILSKNNIILQKNNLINIGKNDYTVLKLRLD